jgi:adenylate cyclase
MAEQRAQRRLAAILAADVVGYSRLMRADEAGTLERLKSLRKELIDPKIAEYGGRVVKTTGDGILIEFPSAVDAVQHAVDVQQEMARRSAGIAENQRMEIRMGINVGDVIIEGDDLFGDGVNVAARLEGLAEAGGICISGNAYEQVRDKLQTRFEDLGEQTVKNIDRPVQAYRIGLDYGDQTDETHIQNEPKPRSLGERPSIAVLPFDNMSGDPEQEFFVDGLAEDIITALSKIERMRVIARHSTFEYKGRAIDLRRIADELGVRYVLEGSVRSGGNRLRITAQLIDANDGSHLWAERYDRTVDDLFDIQDEITKEIVTSLRVELTDGEQAGILARGTNNIEAWQYAVRASELISQLAPSSYFEVRNLAEKATSLDLDYAHAWALLAFSYWYEGRLGHTGNTDAKFAHADERAQRALALDESAPWVIGINALLATPLGRPEEGVEIARRGLDRNPSNADARFFLGYALTSAGHFDEAEEHLRAAISLNPFCPNYYRGSLSRALMCLGQFDEALTLADEVLEAEPTNLLNWINRIAICQLSGRKAEAKKSVGEVRRLAPNLRVGHLGGIALVSVPEIAKRYSDAVRDAGLPE